MQYLPTAAKIHINNIFHIERKIMEHISKQIAEKVPLQKRPDPFTVHLKVKRGDLLVTRRWKTANDR